MKPIVFTIQTIEKRTQQNLPGCCRYTADSVFWIIPCIKQWCGEWREPYYLFLLMEKYQAIKKKKEPVSILYCLTICQACFNKLILHKNYKLYQKRFKKSGFKEISTCDKRSVSALPSNSASLAVVADKCFFNISVSSDKDFNSCSLLSPSFVFSSSCSSNAVVLCLAFSSSLSCCISLSFSVRR